MTTRLDSWRKGYTTGYRASLCVWRAVQSRVGFWLESWSGKALSIAVLPTWLCISISEADILLFHSLSKQIEFALTVFWKPIPIYADLVERVPFASLFFVFCGASIYKVPVLLLHLFFSFGTALDTEWRAQSRTWYVGVHWFFLIFLPQLFLIRFGRCSDYISSLRKNNLALRDSRLPGPFRIR